MKRKAIYLCFPILAAIAFALLPLEPPKATAQETTLEKPHLEAEYIDSGLTLKWTEVEGAEFYEVYLWNVNWKRLDDGSLTTTSYSLGPLPLETTYYFTVRATADNGSQVSPWSNYAKLVLPDFPTFTPTPTITPTPTPTPQAPRNCPIAQYFGGSWQAARERGPILQPETSDSFREQFGEEVGALDVGYVGYNGYGELLVIYVDSTRNYAAIEYFAGCRFLRHDGWYEISGYFDTGELQQR